MASYLNKMTANDPSKALCCSILVRHLPVVSACYHAHSGGVVLRLQIGHASGLAHFRQSLNALRCQGTGTGMLF